MKTTVRLLSRARLKPSLGLPPSLVKAIILAWAVSALTARPSQRAYSADLPSPAEAGFAKAGALRCATARGRLCLGPRCVPNPPHIAKVYEPLRDKSNKIECGIKWFVIYEWVEFIKAVAVATKWLAEDSFRNLSANHGRQIVYVATILL